MILTTLPEITRPPFPGEAFLTIDVQPGMPVMDILLTKPPDKPDICYSRKSHLTFSSRHNN